MGRNCEICGRGTQVGNNVPRKGLVKKKGGTGSKIGVKTKRTFKVNIQSKYLTIDNTRKKVRVCTRCLRTLEKVTS
jgi:large subunit ribosomal protein L28